jgi:glycerol-3-phosphate O-acyltransferase / dihydroxyacetone phosphate acyltransferase
VLLYALMRAIAGTALRWFYSDIQVEGRERIPRDRPLLLVVNHPNALVDALLVVSIVPRRVLLTAKSTIFVNPLASLLLRWLGVLPLFRTSDVAREGGRADPARNRDTFRAVVAALRRGGAVMIFPEGKSHDEPSLAPLKSGAARLALQARESEGASRLAIVPIGLTFERKDAPRTRVFAQIGEALAMETWRAPEKGAAEALTTEIDTRLRAVTLNYATTDDAARAMRIASLVAAIFEDLPEIGVVDRHLGDETAIARRIDDLAARIAHAGAKVRAHAEQLVQRLDALQRSAAEQGVLLEDVRISLEPRRAARFALREGWLLLVAGPFALWGRLNHWLPFRAARVIAMRSVESAVDPAMRTLVAGASLVLIAYLLQSLAVGLIWGAVPAFLYLVSLPVTADINLYLSDRLRRATRRARAFLRFHRDPELRLRLAHELSALRDDIATFDRALRAQTIAEPV